MKKILAVFTAMLLMLGSTAVFAEETTTQAGTCEFTGSSMESSFDSTSVAVSVAEMEPGDSVYFSIDVKNTSNEKTDWYMSNAVLSSLEDAQSVAENGGYTYVLTFTDSTGTVKSIYSSDTVGGDSNSTKGAANLGEGLYEATNSLDEFFYFVTLNPGEYGTVKLMVSLDGESQGNIYQDTLAKLMMNFAVETPTKTYTTTTPVKTGDIFLWASVLLVFLGILLILFGFIKNRKDKKKNTVAATLLAFAVLVPALLNTTSVKADANYTYTVTISTGSQGILEDLSDISVVNQSGKSDSIAYNLNESRTKLTITGLHYGDIISCAAQSAVSTGIDSKYYVKGIRLSGRDNNTVAKSAFNVEEDQDYVIAYGIPGNLTEYTIRYVDVDGNEIADSQTFYGNVGDEPVIAYRYIDGYVPTTFNLNVVLDADVTKNVFDFTYTAAPTTVIVTPGANNPGGNNPGGNNPGGDAGAENPAGENQDNINIVEPLTPLNDSDTPADPGINESTLIEDEGAPKSSNPFVYLNERGLLIPIILGILAVIVIAIVIIVLTKTRKKNSVDTESEKVAKTDKVDKEE